MQKLRTVAIVLNAILVVEALLVQLVPITPLDSPPTMLDLTFAYLTIVAPLISLFVLSDREQRDRQVL